MKHLISHEAAKSSISGSRFSRHKLNHCQAPFQSSLFEIEGGASSKIDQHSVKEIWYIVNGAGTVTLGADSFDVNAPAVIYIESGIEHSVANPEGSDLLQIISIWYD